MIPKALFDASQHPAWKAPELKAPTLRNFLTPADSADEKVLATKAVQAPEPVPETETDATPSDDTPSLSDEDTNTADTTVEEGSTEEAGPTGGRRRKRRR